MEHDRAQRPEGRVGYISRRDSPQERQKKMGKGVRSTDLTKNKHQPGKVGDSTEKSRWSKQRSPSQVMS